jgi:hypothetical protein
VPNDASMLLRVNAATRLREAAEALGVQIGTRSIGQCQMRSATSGKFYGLAMRGRTQARRLRRPASRLRGLTSASHRQMGIDVAFRQIWLSVPRCGFDRFRRCLMCPVQTFSR